MQLYTELEGTAPDSVEAELKWKEFESCEEDELESDERETEALKKDSNTFLVASYSNITQCKKLTSLRVINLTIRLRLI